jgi:hypothetical protein
VKSEQGEGVTLSCRQEETRQRKAQIAGQRKLGFIIASMIVEQMVEMDVLICQWEIREKEKQFC